MSQNDEFDTLIQGVRKTVRQLSSHDPDYEVALRTGAIPEALGSSITLAFVQLWLALDVLVRETIDRCAIDVEFDEPRLLDLLACRSRDFRSVLEAALPGLLGSQPLVADEFFRLHNVLDVDGWLRPLASITRYDNQLPIRRAVGLASFSSTDASGLQLALTAESGDMIPMLAPILLRPIALESGQSGSAYYLALPDGREVVSFMDRCARGVAQFGDGLRSALAGCSR